MFQRNRTHRTPTTASSRITARVAFASDGPQLDDLAALDSARPLPSPVILGELDGALVAARSLLTGREVADPFVATGDVLALLRTRSSQLTDHPFPRRARLRVAWAG